MQFRKLSQSMLPAGFAFSLLASPTGFVLTAPDNSISGQGTFEESLSSVANIKVMLHGLEYISTDITLTEVRPSVLSLQRQGLRSDRAFAKSLSLRHKKTQVHMVATDGSELTCDLTISGVDVGGQCFSPDHHLALTIKSTPG